MTEFKFWGKLNDLVNNNIMNGHVTCIFGCVV